MDTDLALRCIGALLAAAAATELAIRYALRRQILDLPGLRRAHTVPTPRGGGIAIVVVVLGCAAPLAVLAPLQALLLGLALVLVAGVGWWDDHRSLGPLPRILVQVPAAVLVAAALLDTLAAGQGPLLTAALGVFVVLTTVWSINLHNFMDGMNGFLTLQALWIFAMVWLLGLLGLPHGLGGLPLLLAAACLGFLPFNFPRARIFLGDVGSGALGLLIAAVLWFAVCAERRWVSVGLLLGSTFFIDATATLLLRFWRGRRWYHAHREHLYQWLVRSGSSHARIVSYYMAWNLLLIAPLALLAASSSSVLPGAAAAAAAYAIGVGVWWRARVALVAGARRRA